MVARFDTLPSAIRFFSPDAFWKGIIMGFGPCIFFKARR